MFGAAVVLAVFGVAAAAHAESPWYVSGSFGGYFKEDQSGAAKFRHGQDEPYSATGTDRRAFDPGYIVSLAIGYHLTPHIRLEAEGGYFTYRGSTVHPFTTNPSFPALNGQTFDHISGDRFLRYTATANAFYDFSPIGRWIAPYVGGGVGASADHQTQGLFAASNGTTFRTSGGKSTQGLAFVEGGLTLALSPHWSIAPAYRYQRFFASNEDVAHIAKVSLRYRF